MKNRMKLFLLTISSLLILTSVSANAQVKFMNPWTEPILFERNLVEVSDSCKQEIRRQVYKFLDDNNAINDELNPYDEMAKGGKFSTTCLSIYTDFDTCLAKHNIEVYEVAQSLMYSGASLIVDAMHIHRIAFRAYPDMPLYDSVRADIDNKCRLTNFRMSYKWHGATD